MRNTWKPFFIWKGINSLDMGIETLGLPPLTRAEQRVDKVTVPGRHGVLHVTDGTFDGTALSVPIGMNGGGTDKIFSWLTGSGDVVFSNEPDRKREAIIVNKISLEQVVRQLRKGQVQFDCQPFKYETTQSTVELTAPGVLYNKGTMESEPIFMIYGSGEITVTINGKLILLTNVVDYVVVDSRIKNAYREDDNLMNHFMRGEFPTLGVGMNTISWSGNVSKIKILPYWRWL